MQFHGQIHYRSAGGVGIRRSAQELDYARATEQLAEALDTQQGVLLASGFEYPGRYTRWDIGFVNPPLEFVAKGRDMSVRALNRRGEILLPEVQRALRGCEVLTRLECSETCLQLSVSGDSDEFSEELRSRRPSVFSVLRSVIAHFSSSEDPYLGLYGAFGYDLTFQFEDIERHQQRDANSRDLVLYLPDQITVSDHRSEKALCYSYEFICRGPQATVATETTGGFRRTGEQRPFVPASDQVSACDHGSGEYAGVVEQALQHFRRGDIFEVVPGQCFSEPCKDSPAAIFKRLRRLNPAPYGALMNLGESEYLVAASPEMFVRVRGREIETCPISGTIARGADAIGDARQIKRLLNSEKDESELSMCTDVDRNDKARVCVPGSVEVIGRRQIEIYSRLIHTVDHVRGELRPEFDGLDGFLAHSWAVTVTGAPKLAAMQFIEKHEKSPRRWYGGALGQLGFDGNLNTGLTLRTIQIRNGIAEVRAGATLLVDSDPVTEEQETCLKASALVAAVRGEEKPAAPAAPRLPLAGSPISALMVDHEDSFVHSLAAFFRCCGVELLTLRPEAARRRLQTQRPELLILSSGPSRPQRFRMHDTIEMALKQEIPLFGVCLGLQGIVEYFGGELTVLDYPMHGKPSLISHSGGSLFRGIAGSFTAGRYHSLVAATMPDCLKVTATADGDRVMAVEHRTLPVSAVQFHPESIMSLEHQIGRRLIANVVAGTAAARRPALKNRG